MLFDAQGFTFIGPVEPNIFLDVIRQNQRSRKPAGSLVFPVIPPFFDPEAVKAVFVKQALFSHFVAVIYEKWQ